MRTLTMSMGWMTQVASMPLAPPFTKGFTEFQTVLFLGASPILAPAWPLPLQRVHRLSYPIHGLLAFGGHTSECCPSTSTIPQSSLLCGLQRARASGVQFILAGCILHLQSVLAMPPIESSRSHKRRS